MQVVTFVRFESTTVKRKKQLTAFTVTVKYLISIFSLQALDLPERGSGIVNFAFKKSPTLILNLY